MIPGYQKRQMAFDGDMGKITTTGQMIHEQPLVDMAKRWIASRTLSGLS